MQKEAQRKNACICAGVTPKEQAMQIYGGSPHRLLVVYNKSCVEHGITTSSYKPMREVFRRAWVDYGGALLLRDRDGARIVERSSDRKKALIEWVEYEFAEKEEGVA